MINRIVNYINEFILKYPESKLFFLLFLISNLFALLKKADLFVLFGQYFIMTWGLRNIKCMFEGNCIKDIYFLLFVFTFTNIIIVVLHDYFSLLFPQTTKKIDNNKNQTSMYSVLFHEIVDDIPFLKKLFNDK